MVPVDVYRWKKSATFESILSTICIKINVQNTADLMSIMSQEMPADVTEACMESTRCKEKIIASMTDVNNLSGLDFLHSNSHKSKNLACYNKKDRYVNVTYIKLGCCIDGRHIIQHITQAPVNFQFCLKLPQSLYDNNIGNIIPFLITIKGGGAILTFLSPKTLALDFNTDTNADSDDEDKHNEAAGDDNESTALTTPSKDTAIHVTPNASRLIGSSTSTSTELSFLEI